MIATSHIIRPVKKTYHSECSGNECLLKDVICLTEFGKLVVQKKLLKKSSRFWGLYIYILICSVAKSCVALWPHEWQQASLSIPPPGACKLLCISHLIQANISSSLAPFSFCMYIYIITNVDKQVKTIVYKSIAN